MATMRPPFVDTNTSMRAELSGNVKPAIEFRVLLSTAVPPSNTIFAGPPSLNAPSVTDMEAPLGKYVLPPSM